MAELEREEEREKVPVRKRERRVEQELPEKALEPEEQRRCCERGTHTKGGIEK